MRFIFILPLFLLAGCNELAGTAVTGVGVAAAEERSMTPFHCHPKRRLYQPFIHWARPM